MKKNQLGVVFCIGCLILFPLYVRAANQLIFFPGSDSFFDHGFSSMQKTANKIVLKPFPRGADARSLWVTADGVSQWRYYPAPDSVDALLAQVSGPVHLGRKAGQNLHYVMKDGQSWVFANSKSVVVTDKNEFKLDRPEDVRLMPELVVFMDDEALQSDVRVTGFLRQLVSDFSYRVDYNEVQAELAIRAVLRVNNQTGFEFKNANLVTRVEAVREPVVRRYQTTSVAAMDKGRSEVTVGKADEAYVYRLDSPQVVVPGKSTFQLFAATIGDVQKIYRYSPSVYGERSANLKRLVNVILKFRNTTDFPLAHGRVQLFSDSDFIAKASLGPVSKTQWVELGYGRAFDLMAKKEIVSEKSEKRRVVERRVRLTIRNFKDHKATVHIRDRLPGGGWKIIKSSQKYETPTATEVDFWVDVPAGQLKSVVYTTRLASK